MIVFLEGFNPDAFEFTQEKYDIRYAQRNRGAYNALVELSSIDELFGLANCILADSDFVTSVNLNGTTMTIVYEGVRE